MRPPSYYFFVILVGALWSAAAAMASFNPNGYYAPNIQQGWFQETEALWPGQRFSIEMAKREDGQPAVLFEGRSKFQDVLVFDSKTYGKVLVLDGVIQLTERDEHAYQEMITHLPLFSHPDPKRVLIVGGGDGGVLREVCRHPGVEAIDFCELDSMVCDVAKQFFGESTATCFGDKRCNLIHADAAEFIRGDSHNGPYDVIIVDSSDPVGPAETLFTAEFYDNMKKSLAPGGVICCQGECMWLHLDLIGTLLTKCCALFPTVEYSFTTIPTYPSGQIGFVLMSLDDRKDAVKYPARDPSPEMQAQLRYYNPQVHLASFVLPQFAKQAVDSAKALAGRTPEAPPPTPRPSPK